MPHFYPSSCFISREAAGLQDALPASFTHILCSFHFPLLLFLFPRFRRFEFTICSTGHFTIYIFLSNITNVITTDQAHTHTPQERTNGAPVHIGSSEAGNRALLHCGADGLVGSSARPLSLFYRDAHLIPPTFATHIAQSHSPRLPVATHIFIFILTESAASRYPIFSLPPPPPPSTVNGTDSAVSTTFAKQNKNFSPFSVSTAPTSSAVH